MARWRVDILRKRSDHLGMVEADTEKEAIEKAIKLFNIGPDLEPVPWSWPASEAIPGRSPQQERRSAGVRATDLLWSRSHFGFGGGDQEGRQ